ncbi:MAG: PAS domain S-box protein, partial [Methanophagales archaeon]|nr:PAS domain S-box protein [Methanophagales archaeon]
MKGEDKTKGQPIHELVELRQRVKDLETCLDMRKRAEEALQVSEMQLRETKDYLDDVIKSSADAIVVVDMEGRVRSWNKAAEDYMGYTASEVIGRSNKKFFADPEEADRIMELVLRAGELKNYRTVVLRKDQKPVHISMSAALLKDKNGVPIGTVRVSRDITKEVELEEKIKEERDNLNLIFENMTDGVYSVSNEYEVEFMNKVLIDEFGIQVGGICYEVFHKREEPCPRCKNPEVMNGKTVRWEWHSRRKNKTYDLIETPLKNVDGTLSKLTIFRDITERKRAEIQIKASLREKEILLRELHHRVKNNLQIISTLLYLQSGYSKDKEAFEMFKDSQNRIKSMALIHDKLYQFKDLGKIDIAEYIRELVTDLFHSYGVEPDGVKLKIDVHEVLLGVNTAISCGLIINELVSNSLKHAFPDGKEGTIRIELFRSVNENTFTLIVCDNGVSFPEDLDFRNTETLGLQLVIMLVKKLKGTIELDRSRGTEF